MKLVNERPMEEAPKTGTYFYRCKATYPGGQVFEYHAELTAQQAEARVTQFADNTRRFLCGWSDKAIAGNE